MYIMVAIEQVEWWYLDVAARVHSIWPQHRLLIICHYLSCVLMRCAEGSPSIATTIHKECLCSAWFHQPTTSIPGPRGCVIVVIAVDHARTSFCLLDAHHLVIGADSSFLVHLKMLLLLLILWDVEYLSCACLPGSIPVNL